MNRQTDSLYVHTTENPFTLVRTVQSSLWTRLLILILLCGWSGLVWAKGGPHPPQQSGAYKIDAEHSAIQFKAHHHDAGYTWGHFVRFKGTFETGEGGTLISVEATARARSVDTGSEFRDLHLRSAHYLAVWSNPVVHFHSETIEQVEAGHWVVTGPLELHGITLPLTVDLFKTGEGVGPFGKERYGLETEFTISLEEFGIVREGIGDELQLFVNLEGVRR